MADEMLDGSALSSVQEHLLKLGDKVDGLKETVKEHIAKDMKYYNNYNKEETDMEDSSGLIAAMLAGGNRNDGSGVGAGAGAGLGAGLLGGILGGALLGNRGGLLGNGAVAEAAVGVTPAMLSASLAGVTDALQNTTVMQTLGSIQGSIPLSEANSQLALAGAQSDLTNLINSSNIANMQGQALITKGVADAIAASLASQTSIKESVAAYGVANLNATKDSQFAIATIVKDDGEKTRALITSNAISELQRQLTVSQTNALEDRLNSRARETEITITNTNTATSQQVQVQAQQQQQAILLNGILGVLGSLQNAVATNTNMVIGNSGAVATGTQTSNPINVKT